MLSSIIHYFWPDLDNHEIKKYSILSTIFFLIIGSSWLMRSLKNIIFLKIAFPQSLGCQLNHGLMLQPTAKFWTPLIIIPLIFIYGLMIDRYKKETVYYIVIIFYTVIFIGISMLLGMHHFRGDVVLGRKLLALIGWVTFFSVETFYSLIITLLWSFTSSICTTQSAQRGYPLIIVMAQIACIIASVPLLHIDYCPGIWILFLCATLASFSTIFLMHYFLRVIPAHQLVGDIHAPSFAKAWADRHKKEKSPSNLFKGFISGLYLLCTRPYLLGILIITWCYEVVTQIFEYQTLSSAATHINFASITGFAQFQGIFGIAIHCMSLIIALIGTRYFIKRYSLQGCLLLVPIVLLILLCTYLILYFYHPTYRHTLWISMGIMILMYSMAFAINSPTREIMYIPTSTDIKFKSKSWIDIFGTRTAKQGGAQINHMLQHDFAQLIFLGTLCGIGITILWIYAAWYVGRKNKKLRETKTVIE